ncbi:b(0,+)-type amino acid transporter 1-like [Styela clava]
MEASDESSDSINATTESKKSLLHRLRIKKDNEKEKSSEPEELETLRLKREVGFIGGVSLIVSSMIGSGIFVSPKGVFRFMGSVGSGLLTWLACGVLATFGALSYAEVGTMIPKSGGEYPILLEAFGPIPAYLFAWTSTTILKPSALAILGLTFSKYALSPMFPDCETPEMAMKLVAAVVVGVVVFINCYSVKLSTRFLTVFSVGKIISLLIIIIGGIVMLANGHTKHLENSFEGETPGVREIALAFYQGLWAYDGWNQLNYIIEELKNPYVNLPRAIVTAMILVTGLYLMTNVAYMTAMSRIQLLNSPAVGTVFGVKVLGVMSWIIPLAVTWSVFGTCLGSCFAAGRISYTASREGHFNQVLSMIHIKRLTPAPAVLLNGLLAIIMIIPNDFDTLVDYFSFCMWMFHGGTCAALIYFRITQPNRKRPVKVPIIIPIIVCIAAVCLVFAPIIDEPKIHYLFAVLYVLFGLVFYIPFVHFKKKSQTIRKINILLQKLLQVSTED